MYLEPMYHVTRAQTSRQDGGLSTMFISWAIELCDVSRVVLHLAATLLWIKSFYFMNYFYFTNCCVRGEDGL